MFDTEMARVRAAAPAQAVWWSARLERYRHERSAVVRGVVKAPSHEETFGVHLTVWVGGPTQGRNTGPGVGYAATADLSATGLSNAFAQALGWAEASAGRLTPGLRVPDWTTGAEAGPKTGAAGWHWDGFGRIDGFAAPLAAKRERLEAAAQALKQDPRIVDWSAALWLTRREQVLITSDGAEIRQRFDYILPTLRAVAADDHDSQMRGWGRDMVRQGGLEVLDLEGFEAAAQRIGREAIELLEAPNCPSETTEIVLAPDQMALQIHESIGHPLELDRILGDERNYAGTSFVTPDMFGSYAYGSPLLNVTFDPSVPGEVASYTYDDTGTKAQRDFLIKDGILVRGIGGRASQARSQLPGIAVERACHWDRPPIDRMANLNVEPGEGSLEDVIAPIERGVYMETNRSWSIDDSRNKFQFGCEYGRMIENGRLTHVVKNPSYRGISAKFWRALSGVGGTETRGIAGTPFCGKGEPNQGIRVGHASPVCRFSGIDVFGGV